MNIKGGPRGKPIDLAKHLEKDENEVARIVRSQDVAARDIEGALVEMDAMGACLRTKRTLCHMQINPQPGYDFAMSHDFKITLMAGARREVALNESRRIDHIVSKTKRV